MSDKHKHIAFLCGHFKRSEPVNPDTLAQLGWQRLTFSEEERYSSKRYYYPEFVDFFHTDSMDDGCVRFTRQVDQSITMAVGVESKKRSLPFTVKEITLYFMPQNMVLYSIHVEQEVSSFSDCSSLMFDLRYIDDFSSETYEGFRKVAIDPIVEVYNRAKGCVLQDYTHLVENGNKLRLFQIIHAADGSLTNDEDWRRQLYQLATFMPAAVDGDLAADGLFTEHMSQEIEENSVAVFPDWIALALLDTFTILASGNEGQTVNWIERYFGMIYIHAVFQKMCLFDFNNHFKRAQNEHSWKEVTKLVCDFESFERRCCFNKISYNFLPLLIAETINNSLEINDEMNQLYRIMEKERTRSEEVSRKKMNRLLVCISFLTLFSAIWDATSMSAKIFNFEENLKTFGIVGLIMTIVVIVILVYLYKRNVITDRRIIKRIKR